MTIIPKDAFLDEAIQIDLHSTLLSYQIGIATNLEIVSDKNSSYTCGTISSDQRASILHGITSQELDIDQGFKEDDIGTLRDILAQSRGMPTLSLRIPTDTLLNHVDDQDNELIPLPRTNEIHLCVAHCRIALPIEFCPAHYIIYLREFAINVTRRPVIFQTIPSTVLPIQQTNFLVEGRFLFPRHGHAIFDNNTDTCVGCKNNSTIGMPKRSQIRLDSCSTQFLYKRSNQSIQKCGLTLILNDTIANVTLDIAPEFANSTGIVQINVDGITSNSLDVNIGPTISVDTVAAPLPIYYWSSSILKQYQGQHLTHHIRFPITGFWNADSLQTNAQNNNYQLEILAYLQQIGNHTTYGTDTGDERTATFNSDAPILWHGNTPVVFANTTYAECLLTVPSFVTLVNIPLIVSVVAIIGPFKSNRVPIAFVAPSNGFIAFSLPTSWDGERQNGMYSRSIVHTRLAVWGKNMRRDGAIIHLFWSFSPRLTFDLWLACHSQPVYTDTDRCDTHHIFSVDTSKQALTSDLNIIGPAKVRAYSTTSTVSLNGLNDTLILHRLTRDSCFIILQPTKEKEKDSTVLIPSSSSTCLLVRTKGPSLVRAALYYASFLTVFETSSRTITETEEKVSWTRSAVLYEHVPIKAIFSTTELENILHCSAQLYFDEKLLTTTIAVIVFPHLNASFAPFLEPQSMSILGDHKRRYIFVCSAMNCSCPILTKNPSVNRQDSGGPVNAFQITDELKMSSYQLNLSVMINASTFDATTVYVFTGVRQRLPWRFTGSEPVLSLTMSSSGVVAIHGPSSLGMIRFSTVSTNKTFPTTANISGELSQDEKIKLYALSLAHASPADPRGSHGAVVAADVLDGISGASTARVMFYSNSNVPQTNSSKPSPGLPSKVASIASMHNMERTPFSVDFDYKRTINALHRSPAQTCISFTVAEPARKIPSSDVMHAHLVQMDISSNQSLSISVIRPFGRNHTGHAFHRNYQNERHNPGQESHVHAISVGIAGQLLPLEYREVGHYWYGQWPSRVQAHCSSSSGAERDLCMTNTVSLATLRCISEDPLCSIRVITVGHVQEQLLEEEGTLSCWQTSRLGVDIFIPPTSSAAWSAAKVLLAHPPHQHHNAYAPHGILLMQHVPHLENTRIRADAFSESFNSMPFSIWHGRNRPFERNITCAGVIFTIVRETSSDFARDALDIMLELVQQNSSTNWQTSVLRISSQVGQTTIHTCNANTLSLLNQFVTETSGPQTQSSLPHLRFELKGYLLSSLGRKISITTISPYVEYRAYSSVTAVLDGPKCFGVATVHYQGVARTLHVRLRTNNNNLSIPKRFQYSIIAQVKNDNAAKLFRYSLSLHSQYSYFQTNENDKRDIIIQYVAVIPKDLFYYTLYPSSIALWIMHDGLSQQLLCYGRFEALLGDWLPGIGHDPANERSSRGQIELLDMHDKEGLRVISWTLIHTLRFSTLRSIAIQLRADKVSKSEDTSIGYCLKEAASGSGCQESFSTDAFVHVAALSHEMITLLQQRSITSSENQVRTESDNEVALPMNNIDVAIKRVNVCVIRIFEDEHHSIQISTLSTCFPINTIPLTIIAPSNPIVNDSAIESLITMGTGAIPLIRSSISYPFAPMYSQVVWKFIDHDSTESSSLSVAPGLILNLEQSRWPLDNGNGSFAAGNVLNIDSAQTSFVDVVLRSDQSLSYVSNPMPHRASLPPSLPSNLSFLLVSVDPWRGKRHRSWVEVDICSRMELPPVFIDPMPKVIVRLQGPTTGHRVQLSRLRLYDANSGHILCSTGTVESLSAYIKGEFADRFHINLEFDSSSENNEYEVILSTMHRLEVDSFLQVEIVVTDRSGLSAIKPVEIFVDPKPFIIINSPNHNISNVPLVQSHSVPYPPHLLQPATSQFTCSVPLQFEQQKTSFCVRTNCTFLIEMCIETVPGIRSHTYSNGNDPTLCDDLVAVEDCILMALVNQTIKGCTVPLIAHADSPHNTDTSNNDAGNTADKNDRSNGENSNQGLITSAARIIASFCSPQWTAALLSSACNHSCGCNIFGQPVGIRLYHSNSSVPGALSLTSQEQMPTSLLFNEYKDLIVSNDSWCNPISLKILDTAQIGYTVGFLQTVLAHHMIDQHQLMPMTCEQDVCELWHHVSGQSAWRCLAPSLISNSVHHAPLLTFRPASTASTATTNNLLIFLGRDIDFDETNSIDVGVTCQSSTFMEVRASQTDKNATAVLGSKLRFVVSVQVKRVPPALISSAGAIQVGIVPTPPRNSIQTFGVFLPFIPSTITLHPNMKLRRLVNSSTSLSCKAYTFLDSLNSPPVKNFLTSQACSLSVAPNDYSVVLHVSTDIGDVSTPRIALKLNISHMKRQHSTWLSPWNSPSCFYNNKPFKSMPTSIHNGIVMCNVLLASNVSSTDSNILNLNDSSFDFGICVDVQSPVATILSVGVKDVHQSIFRVRLRVEDDVFPFTTDPACNISRRFPAVFCTIRPSSLPSSAGTRCQILQHSIILHNGESTIWDAWRNNARRLPDGFPLELPPPIDYPRLHELILSVSEQGSFIIRIWVVDDAGNQSPSTETTVTTAPSCPDIAITTNIWTDEHSMLLLAPEHGSQLICHSPSVCQLQSNVGRYFVKSFGGSINVDLIDQQLIQLNVSLDISKTDTISELSLNHVSCDTTAEKVFNLHVDTRFPRLIMLRPPSPIQFYPSWSADEGDITVQFAVDKLISKMECRLRPFALDWKSCCSQQIYQAADGNDLNECRPHEHTGKQPFSSMISVRAAACLAVEGSVANDLVCQATFESCVGRLLESVKSKFRIGGEHHDGWVSCQPLVLIDGRTGVIRNQENVINNNPHEADHAPTFVDHKPFLSDSLWLLQTRVTDLHGKTSQINDWAWFPHLLKNSTLSLPDGIGSDQQKLIGDNESVHCNQVTTVIWACAVFVWCLLFGGLFLLLRSKDMRTYYWQGLHATALKQRLAKRKLDSHNDSMISLPSSRNNNDDRNSSALFLNRSSAPIFHLDPVVEEEHAILRSTEYNRPVLGQGDISPLPDEMGENGLQPTPAAMRISTYYDDTCASPSSSIPYNAESGSMSAFGEEWMSMLERVQKTVVDVQETALDRLLKIRNDLFDDPAVDTNEVCCEQPLLGATEVECKDNIGDYEPTVNKSDQQLEIQRQQSQSACATANTPDTNDDEEIVFGFGGIHDPDQTSNKLYSVDVDLVQACSINGSGNPKTEDKRQRHNESRERTFFEDLSPISERNSESGAALFYKGTLIRHEAEVLSFNCDSHRLADSCLKDTVHSNDTVRTDDIVLVPSSESERAFKPTNFTCGIPGTATVGSVELLNHTKRTLAVRSNQTPVLPVSTTEREITSGKTTKPSLKSGIEPLNLLTPSARERILKRTSNVSGKNADDEVTERHQISVVQDHFNHDRKVKLQHSLDENKEVCPTGPASSSSTGDSDIEML